MSGAVLEKNVGKCKFLRKRPYHTGDSPTDMTTSDESLLSMILLSGSSQTPAASTPAPPACNAPLPHHDIVSRYRNLDAVERVWRLMWAATDGEAGEVRALLSAGADVSARDTHWFDYTALHWAAKRGHVDAASCLLASGAEVDAKDTVQQTPLHLAAWCGRSAVVRLLTAASADPNARTVDGWTPLHYAAMRGHAKAAAALLEAGADGLLRNDDGDTPLDRAKNWRLRKLLAGS